MPVVACDRKTAHSCHSVDYESVMAKFLNRKRPPEISSPPRPTPQPLCVTEQPRHTRMCARLVVTPPPSCVRAVSAHDACCTLHTASRSPLLHCHCAPSRSDFAQTPHATGCCGMASQSPNQQGSKQRGRTFTHRSDSRSFRASCKLRLSSERTLCAVPTT